jgi:hypothetical protein
MTPRVHSRRTARLLPRARRRAPARPSPPAIYSGFATTLATGLGRSRLELDMRRILAGDKTIRAPPRCLLTVRFIAHGDDQLDLAASEPVLAVCAGQRSVRLTIQRH